uniref:Toll-like receptor 13 n=1 Tax=Crassostrea virginica TaxID=6565 RepID=A0A8B8ASS4_CRAVI|nr:toll-like receptor 13 [Crassostrea virginica]
MRQRTAIALLLYSSLLVVVTGRCLISQFVDECNNIGFLWNCSHLHLNRLPMKFPPELENQNVTLDLSFNNFTIITEETFKEISKQFDVTKIVLHHNSLSKIEKNAFGMLSTLCSLDLSDCNLDKSQIDEHAFVNTPKLKSLRIYQNNFQQTGYPDVSIAKIKSLEYLKIDLFNGFLFSSAFENLTKLSRIEFHLINDFSLHKNSFSGLKSSPISSLDMNFRKYVKCDVTEDLFCSFPYLTEELILNFGGKCNVTVALRSLNCLQHRKIRNLFMYENKELIVKDLTILNDWSMKYLINICVNALSLGQCNIYLVKSNIINTTLWHCLEYLDVSGNNIHVVDTSTITSLFTLPKIRNINFCCNNPPIVGFRDISHRYILPQNMIINITFPNTLEVVDFSKNYIHNALKFSLACSAENLQEVYLQNTNFPFESVTQCRFPSLTKVDISQNKHARIKSDLFQNFRNLRQIIAVDVDLSFPAISNFKNLFHNLTKLSLLDISRNNMAALPKSVFIYQKKSLLELNLDFNKFTVIPISILFLEKLQFLYMRNNLISQFSRNDQIFLQSMPNHSTYIEGNPISCECSRIQSLHWTKNHQHLFGDLHAIECTESKTRITELFQKDVWRKFELNCQANTWLIIASILLFVTLLVLLILSAVKRYRAHLEYVILRLKNRWKGTHLGNQGNPFLYDVYVSYSDSDYAWIIQNLYPRLEHLNMKSWLKDKDSIPGGWEAEEIVKCINDSRKVMFVISDSFLDVGWSSYAVQMAVTHAFHNRRQESIVVIIKDNVLLDRLPNDIKNIWWCIKYFRWTGSETDEEILNKISDMLKAV